MLIFAITVGHRAGHLTNLPDGARTVSDCIQNILLGHLVAVTKYTSFFFQPLLPEKRAGDTYLPFFGCQN